MDVKLAKTECLLHFQVGFVQVTPNSNSLAIWIFSDLPELNLPRQPL